MVQGETPAMAAAADLTAQVLQAVPERALEAAAKALAHVVDFD
jgi:hypothetical protein